MAKNDAETKTKTGEEPEAVEPAIVPAVTDEGKAPKVAKKGVTKEDEPAKLPAEKLQMTPEEFQAAVTKAIEDNKRAEEEARVKAEAEAQGNFKQLYEDTQLELQRAQLTAWRSKALIKFSLPEKVLTFLNGETEEEIMASAKQLKSVLDANAQNVVDHVTDDSLPFRDSHRRSHRGHELSGRDKSLVGMAGIFPNVLKLENLRSTDN